jgi:hypothetical protein
VPSPTAENSFDRHEIGDVHYGCLAYIDAAELAQQAPDRPDGLARVEGYARWPAGGAGEPRTALRVGTLPPVARPSGMPATEPSHLQRTNLDIWSTTTPCTFIAANDAVLCITVDSAAARIAWRVATAATFT